MFIGSLPSSFLSSVSKTFSFISYVEQIILSNPYLADNIFSFHYTFIHLFNKD